MWRDNKFAFYLAFFIMFIWLHFTTLTKSHFAFTSLLALHELWRELRRKEDTNKDFFFCEKATIWKPFSPSALILQSYPLSKITAEHWSHQLVLVQLCCICIAQAFSATYNFAAHYRKAIQSNTLGQHCLIMVPVYLQMNKAPVACVSVVYVRF